MNLLFAGLGDWIESNILGVLGLMMTLVGFIAWLVRLEQSARATESNMNKLQQEVAAQMSAFSAHKTDGDAHVNHLYMSSMSRRVDKLEASVASGFDHIDAKMDRFDDKLDRLMDKAMSK